MYRALWLSLFLMKLFDSYQAKDDISMWNILKASNVTNLYPPLYIHPSIAVPALTYFEPVAHNHPPANILKKLIESHKKSWKIKYESSEDVSSSDTETDTDTDSSDSDSESYY